MPIATFLSAMFLQPWWVPRDQAVREASPKESPEHARNSTPNRLSGIRAEGVRGGAGWLG